MRNLRLILTLGVIGSFVALGGCTTTREIPIPKPVLIPGPVQYVPLPAETTDDCGTAPKLQDGMKGGELLEAARAWRARAKCRDVQIESIKRLQPAH